MIIYKSIQGNIVLTESSLVATNKSYCSMLNGRTEADILADKVIVPKNLWSTSGTLQRYTHFSGATKAFYLLFGAENILLLIFVLVNPTHQTRQNMRLLK